MVWVAGEPYLQVLQIFLCILNEVDIFSCQEWLQLELNNKDFKIKLIMALLMPTHHTAQQTLSVSQLAHTESPLIGDYSIRIHIIL